jgi:hypothetical protein
MLTDSDGSDTVHEIDDEIKQAKFIESRSSDFCVLGFQKLLFAIEK